MTQYKETIKTLRKHAQHFPFMTLKASWPWRFEGKLIYSLLAYRAKAGAGESENGLAKETRLSRTTVRKMVRELAENGLAVHRDKLWLALEPHGDSAEHFPDGSAKWKHWSDSLQSDPIFVPSERLSIRAAATYSLLLSLARKGKGVVKDTSHQHLAKLLGIHAGTIKKCLAELVEASLIDVFSAPNRVHMAVLIMPAKEQHLVFFARRGSGGLNVYEGLEKAQSVAEGRQRQFTHPESEATFQQLLEARVPRKVAAELVSQANANFVDTRQFRLAIEEKRKFNEKQFERGKSGPHPGYLIRAWLEELIESQRRRDAPPTADEVFGKLKPPRSPVVGTAMEKKENPLDLLGSQLDDHSYTTSRVDVAGYRVSQTRCQLHRHCQDTRVSADDVYRNVLMALNRYWGTEERATEDQFFDEIDKQLAKHDLPPLPASSDEPGKREYRGLEQEGGDQDDAEHVRFKLVYEEDGVGGGDGVTSVVVSVEPELTTGSDDYIGDNSPAVRARQFDSLIDDAPERSC